AGPGPALRALRRRLAALVVLHLGPAGPQLPDQPGVDRRRGLQVPAPALERLRPLQRPGVLERLRPPALAADPGRVAAIAGSLDPVPHRRSRPGLAPAARGV